MSEESVRKPSGHCNFLFVGSGVQRKGLHVLCKAWSDLQPSDAHLTIVARSMDPSIRELVPRNNATLLSGVSPSQLEEEYRKAHVFVMPSLVEGFGYVYLEALRFGCYCIGTENSGLPDLGQLTGVAELVVPGSVQDLQAALARASQKHSAGELDGKAPQLKVKEYPWLRFRESIVSAVAAGPSIA